MKLLLFALLAAPASAQKCTPTDITYFNGNILTGKNLLAPNPERVEAISISNGKIVYAGTNARALECTTKRVDLHGAFALPGFNDAHTHIAFAGQQRLTVDLDNVPSLAAMQAKIKAYAATLAPGQWITGGGWDHTKWPSKTLPTRQDLDAVTGSHPAYLERTDGHIAIVNTAALAAAGIPGKTAVPQGSQIDLAPDGSPTGILRERGVLNLVQVHIPKPDPARRRQALTLSLNDALAHGVTSVQDFSDWDDFLALESLERDHQLHVRVSEWLTFGDPIATLKAHQASHDRNDPMLHTGMLKGFMDGSLGSRTAALAAPYADDPKNSGLPRYDQKTLNEMIIERDRFGFQIGFHAIGDRANVMALSAFAADKEAIVRYVPARFRIEHAQVLLPADFDRFANLYVIASMQPSHLLTDMAWATDRLGPERAKYAYAWRSFLDHHVTLAFGTDYPVESISPFRGLYSAVTRQNEAGTQTFQPQEKLTLAEALYAYTQGSAFAENMEQQKGRLEPGFFADIAVLDRDITRATPHEILATKVIRTIVNGETVYTVPSLTTNAGSSSPDFRTRVSAEDHD